MNRFITNVFVALSLLAGAEIYAANEESITIPLSENDNKGGGNKRDIPSRGDRSLRAPVLCTLNFTEGTFELTAAQEITTYEVWDADQEILIASFTESADLLNFLSNSSDCYTLCFLSEDYVYTGYYGW